MQCDPQVVESIDEGANEHVFTPLDWIVAIRLARLAPDFDHAGWVAQFDRMRRLLEAGQHAPPSRKGRFFLRCISNKTIRRAVFGALRKWPLLLLVFFLFVPYDRPYFFCRKGRS